MEFVVGQDESHKPLLGSTAVQTMHPIQVKHQNILHAVHTSGQRQFAVRIATTIVKQFGEIYKEKDIWQEKLKLETDPSAVSKNP